MRALWLGLNTEPAAIRDEITNYQAKGGFPYKQCLELIRHVYLNTSGPSIQGNTISRSFITEIQSVNAFEMIHKTLIDGIFYSIRKNPKSCSVVFYICTECNAVYNTKQSAEKHRLQAHDQTIKEGVNIIRDFVSFKNNNRIVPTSQGIQETYLYLIVDNMFSLTGNEVEWNEIRIISPLSGRDIKALDFNNAILRELHEMEITLELENTVNPFSTYKSLISIIHTELSREHKLDNPIY